MAATKNVWSVCTAEWEIKRKNRWSLQLNINVVPTVIVVPYVYSCIDEDENVCCKKCLIRTWTGEHKVDIRTKKKKTKDAQLSGKKACRWLPRIVILSHASQTQCEWNCQGKYVPCLWAAPGRAHEPRNKTK